MRTAYRAERSRCWGPPAWRRASSRPALRCSACEQRRNQIARSRSSCSARRCAAPEEPARSEPRAFVRTSLTQSWRGGLIRRALPVSAKRMCSPRTAEGRLDLVGIAPVRGCVAWSTSPPRRRRTGLIGGCWIRYRGLLRDRSAGLDQLQLELLHLRTPNFGRDPPQTISIHDANRPRGLGIDRVNTVPTPRCDPDLASRREAPPKNGGDPQRLRDMNERGDKDRNDEGQGAKYQRPANDRPRVRQEQKADHRVPRNKASSLNAP